MGLRGQTNWEAEKHKIKKKGNGDGSMGWWLLRDSSDVVTMADITSQPLQPFWDSSDSHRILCTLWTICLRIPWGRRWVRLSGHPRPPLRPSLDLGKGTHSLGHCGPFGPSFTHALLTGQAHLQTCPPLCWGTQVGYRKKYIRSLSLVVGKETLKPLEFSKWKECFCYL